MKYLLIIIGMMLLVKAMYAQPDRAEVRRGNRAFGRGEFVAAELEYRRALEKDSTSVAARYNLSNARYREEQYEQAEAGLKEKIETFSNPIQRAGAFHNLGNMQLMQKKYAESIESYKDALRLRPNDVETKSNLAYAQKMLENQQDGDGGDDDQDSQDDQDEKDEQDNKENPDDSDNQREQEAPPKISPQDARQMLEAMLQKERETQEKVEKEKAKAVAPPSKKNW